MFDIGFTEVLLIGIVGLIVIGPERLPQVVRTVLGYIRQFKAGFAHIKEEVERELDLDALKDELDDSKAQLNQAVGYDDLHQSLGDLRQESEKLREIATDGFEYADRPLPPSEAAHAEDAVTDAEIEADLHALAKQSRPSLDPDSEADTGIETTRDTHRRNKSQ